MAREFVIDAEIREGRGKNDARRLRKTGKIPAVVYGAYQDALAVAVSPKEVERILHSGSGYNTIFDMVMAGNDPAPVMIVDWQHDPVKGNLLHVDLKRIDLTKRIKVSIPVLIQGDARGVKEQDGLLEAVTRTVDIECLPNEIPENFTLDVTALMLGESLRASDIPMPGSMKLITPGDTVIAHVVALRAEAGTTPAEGAAPEAAGAAEPEVVKRGKKEEEEAEEGKGKKK